MRPSTRRLRRALLDIRPAIYRERQPLANLRILPLGMPIAPEEFPLPVSDDPGWRPVRIGDRWGGQDINAWFNARAQIPQAWSERSEQAQRQDGSRYVPVLRLILGRDRDTFGWPEGLLYVNGRLQQGVNRHHEDTLLRPDDLRAGVLTFHARFWSGMEPVEHRIDVAEIALLDRDAEAFYHLLDLGVDLVDALPESDPLTYALAAALDAAYDAVDMRHVGDAGDPSFCVTITSSLGVLRKRLAELRADYTPQERPRITAVGHGHLDVAWLWQTHHTREKTARTFSVATALMDAYPDYVFLHTTPQVFAWLKDDYPDLYAHVRQRVREGRFEVAGALWLETDTNLVSGEALVRQILYGQRFLQEEFGPQYGAYDTLWLPDCFGYSAAVPQIMLRAGLRTFMTTKMSWSDTNRIPHDTFFWRGLDGSERLAHFITTPWIPFNPVFDTDTYNGKLDIASVIKTWERYKDKAHNGELLLAFGNGDGGAGPTRQHLEQVQALQELPGLPEVRLGRADAYFKRLHARVSNQPDLPAWDGELYLEYHRGVYTTQGWLKRAHRHNEARLLLAETLDAWRYALAPQQTPDSRPALDDAWRSLLLHEFHDILPGSSIGPVYADARAAMEQLAETLDTAIARDLRAIVGSPPEPTSDPVRALAAYNPSPFPQSALLTLPSSDAEHISLPRQEITLGGERALLIEAADVPARSFSLLSTREPTRARTKARTKGPTNETAAHGEQSIDGYLLENDYFRIAFNQRGEIISCVDKRVAGGGRELAPRGQVGNRLTAFEDRPQNFDAWDIEDWYTLKPYDLGDGATELVETGPLRATLRVRRHFQSSVIEQDISLYRSIPRIDFATSIDWHEHHLLLKAAFPLDLRVTSARSEIQYGSIERPTHRNTSWDQARFETSAHRWVDLSEANYGVALLNDGRYGYDIHDSTLRLSLLRSPTYPDPNADQGEQRLIYSLYPHVGDWRAGGVVAAGYVLNHPAVLVPLAEAHTANIQLPTFFVAEPAQAVIETVKRAAEGDDLILRLYEAHGGRCRVRVQSPFPLAAVAECDLLERSLVADGPHASPTYADWLASPVASHDTPHWDADGFTCELRPFEIRSFRLTLRQ
ncbi:MAG: glycoside hydrolase family 38 C-terminal domain-containing protein [Ktedonobacterales bacterium]